ncbi:MAG: hypothetical protein GXP01_02445 [Alphaproteobacteria bacterium]|nr:hypothetical protein [Alphaproteobacteria bacterium]
MTVEPNTAEPKSLWLRRTVFWVTTLVAARIVVLWFGQVQLLVDEEQYWLWGQNLDFGYFSKPPLIGWVLRAVTEIAPESSPFWVRLPAPIFHGITAFLLFFWMRDVYGGRFGFWTALAYLFLPVIAVGSAVISTDTIMAPALVAGLLFYWRLLSRGGTGYALGAGAMIGIAFLAKYAAVYFFAGIGLAAIFLPAMRPGWRQMFLLLTAFFVVISPNLIWNVINELATVRHTIENIGWLQGNGGGFSPKFNELGIFIAGQIIVLGPILFVFLVLSIFSKRSTNDTALLLFAVPVLLIVSLQAVLSKANANWAFVAYLSLTPLVVSWALQRNRVRLLVLAIAVNAMLGLTVPFIGIWPRLLVNAEGTPLLSRMLGRQELSDQIFIAAENLDTRTIVASGRGMLANLFYVGRDKDFKIFSITGREAPRHYYEQKYFFQPDHSEQVLMVTRRAKIACDGYELLPSVEFDTARGFYDGQKIVAFVVPPDCFGIFR